MSAKKGFNLSDLDSMTNLIDSIFSEMNIGLVVFQLEQPNEKTKLRLVYANKQASDYSSADLGKHLGKYIGEAFPPLLESDIPDLYVEVINKRESRNIGAFEYRDAQTGTGYYAIKAFPMPNDCVGVLFENITLRKQMEEMLKNYSEQPEKKKTI